LLFSCNGEFAFNSEDCCVAVNAVCSEIEQLNTGIPETEKQLQDAQLELAQVRKNEAAASEGLRAHRSEVEELRSSMQANRSRGRVLDALMEQKQLGHLPGIFGRLVCLILSSCLHVVVAPFLCCLDCLFIKDAVKIGFT
jgi:structural maintenance of chromosome 4